MPRLQWHHTCVVRRGAKKVSLVGTHNQIIRNDVIRFELHPIRQGG
jgi:hypothetical protein